MEVINLDPAVNEHLRNIQATSSPPVLPQLALEVMVNPPSPESLSYRTYTQVRGQSTSHEANTVSYRILLEAVNGNKNAPPYYLFRFTILLAKCLRPVC